MFLGFKNFNSKTTVNTFFVHYRSNVDYFSNCFGVSKKIGSGSSVLVLVLNSTLKRMVLEFWYPYNFGTGVDENQKV